MRYAKCLLLFACLHDNIQHIVFLLLKCRSRKQKYTRQVEYITSQWSLQLIFRMRNSDHTPKRVKNRDILLWFK
jgi:hypothetical protein